MKKVVHGDGCLPEFTLCGLAFDAHISGDLEEPVEFAQIGDLVTCEDCREVLDHVRRNFKRYRQVRPRD